MAATAILLVGGVFFFMPGGNVTCDEDSPSVAYARGIGEINLARLYAEIQRLVDNGVALDRVPSMSKELPDLLSTYRFNSVSVDGASARMILEGCMDSFVAIRFEGLDDPSKSAVVLSWGEGPTTGSEILWNE